MRADDARKLGTRIVALAVSLMLAGCEGTQSAFNPVGSDARYLYRLTMVLFIGGGIIFLGVTALVLYALFTRPDRRRWLGTRRTIIYGGLIFPTVTLTLLLPYGLWVLRETDSPVSAHVPMQAIGYQFWWRIYYPSDGELPAFTTANEVHVPAGRPVAISLTSGDVIHSFWIPNFAGKLDMIPGRVNWLFFTAERPGIYRGVCAEYCGAQHALMAFPVVVHEPAAFEAWRIAQARPAREPDTPFLERGKALFFSGGCGNCHMIRGTPANGLLGPDLTHVGSRLTIGAGSFPNNIGTLAGWIADTQHLKAGVRMPSYGSFSGEDLRAIAAYLESLK